MYVWWTQNMDVWLFYRHFCIVQKQHENRVVNVCVCVHLSRMSKSHCTSWEKSTPFEMGSKLCVCNVIQKELLPKQAIHIQLLKPVEIVPFRRKSVYPGAFHIHFRQVVRGERFYTEERQCCCYIAIGIHINIEMWNMKGEWHLFLDDTHRNGNGNVMNFNSGILCSLFFGDCFTCWSMASIFFLFL